MVYFTNKLTLCKDKIRQKTCSYRTFILVIYYYSSCGSGIFPIQSIGVIVNPLSANGRGANIWKEIESYLGQNQIPYVAKITQKDGEAKELANFYPEHSLTKSIGTVHDHRYLLKGKFQTLTLYNQIHDKTGKDARNPCNGQVR
ncbi:diacylglycerol kinase family protein [Paenibacillus chondroitinus]